ncbi:MAG: acyltransferase [Clostridia bacterium]|nr:acyltransferase [Clostridia bacterium]
MTKTRDQWIDLVKIYACILVVLGHFFQSMVSSEILSSTPLYEWFNRTIYYFHVPLFFICSGFLYQKYSTVRSVSRWGCNVLKKALSLGIPYFVFSLITYGLKVLFSGSVNNEAQGLLESLFLNPIPPYWYLYALFLLFFITPTAKSRREAVILMIASVLLKCLCFTAAKNIHVLRYIFENEVWFVLGMFLCTFDAPATMKKMKLAWGVVGSIVFIVLSIVFQWWNGILAFFMGALGCFCTLLIFVRLEDLSSLKNVYRVSKYTFPVFLLHTIFAAGLRSVLFKIGIVNPFLHVILGLIISFAGPMLAAVIMSKFKWMEFFLYPNKIIRIGRDKKCQKS